MSVDEENSNTRPLESQETPDGTKRFNFKSMKQYLERVIPAKPLNRVLLVISCMAAVVILITVPFGIAYGCGKGANAGSDGSEAAVPNPDALAASSPVDTLSPEYKTLIEMLRQESPNILAISAELEKHPKIIRSLLLECSIEDPLNEKVTGCIVSLLVIYLPPLPEATTADEELFQALVSPTTPKVLTSQVQEFWFSSSKDLVDNLAGYLVNKDAPNLSVFIAALDQMKIQLGNLSKDIQLDSIIFFQLLEKVFSLMQNLSSQEIIDNLMLIDAHIPNHHLAGFFPLPIIQRLKLEDFCKSPTDMSLRLMTAYNKTVTNLADNDRQFMLDFIFNETLSQECLAKRFVIFRFLVSASLTTQYKDILLAWSKNEKIVKFCAQFGYAFDDLVQNNSAAMDNVKSDCTNEEGFLKSICSYYTDTKLFSQIMGMKPSRLSFVDLVSKLKEGEFCLPTLDNYLHDNSKYNTTHFVINFTTDNIDALASKFTTGTMKNLKNYAVEQLKAAASLSNIKSEKVWIFILENSAICTHPSFKISKGLVTQIAKTIKNPFDVCVQEWSVAIASLYFELFCDTDLTAVWNTLKSKSLITQLSFNDCIKKTQEFSNLELIFEDNALFPTKERRLEMTNSLFDNSFITSPSQLKKFLLFFDAKIIGKFEFNSKKLEQLYHATNQYNNHPNSQGKFGFQSPKKTNNATNGLLTPNTSTGTAGNSKPTGKSTFVTFSDGTNSASAKSNLTGNSADTDDTVTPADLLAKLQLKSLQQDLDKLTEADMLNKLEKISNISIVEFLASAKQLIPKVLSIDNVTKVLEMAPHSDISFSELSSEWTAFYSDCLERYEKETGKYFEMLMESYDSSSLLFKFMFYLQPLDKVKFVIENAEFPKHLEVMCKQNKRPFIGPTLKLVNQYLNDYGASIEFSTYTSYMERLMLAKEYSNSQNPIDNLTHFFKTTDFIDWIKQLMQATQQEHDNILKQKCSATETQMRYSDLKSYFINAAKTLTLDCPATIRREYLEWALLECNDQEFKQIPTLIDETFFQESFFGEFIGEMMQKVKNERLLPIIGKYSEILKEGKNSWGIDVKLDLTQVVNTFDLAARKNLDCFKQLFPTHIPDYLINVELFQSKLQKLLLTSSEDCSFDSYEPCEHLKMITEKLIKRIEDVEKNLSDTTTTSVSTVNPTLPSSTTTTTPEIITPATIEAYKKCLEGTPYQWDTSISVNFIRTASVLKDNLSSFSNKVQNYFF